MDEPATDTRSLRERLLKIQAELEVVPRNGERFGNGGKFMYEFATHDDVVAAVRPVFNNEGILLTSQVVDSQVEFREVGSKLVCVAVIEEEITLTIPGESLSFRSVGAASGEATAVGVARSYAKKYALINFLLIQQGQEGDLGLNQDEDEPVQQPRSRSAKKKSDSDEGTDEKPRARNGKGGGKNGISANIPQSYWDDIEDGWHKKGVIPSSQVNRLFKAAKANGWEEDEVSALIQGKLGCSPEEIPYGIPYNVLVEIFSDCEPNRG
jgi:hypothetical protein